MNDVDVRRSGAGARRAHDEGGRHDARRSGSPSRSGWPPAARPTRQRAAVLEDAFSRQPRAVQGRSRTRPRSIVSHGEYPRDETLERQRAGGLHQRGEPDPESRRDDDEGVAHGSARRLDLRLTRRHFLGRAGVGHRHGRAGASCCSRTCSPRRAAAERRPAACRACRTSRRRPSGSSICSSRGGPSQLDLFDYKPQLAKVQRHRAAGLGPAGPAADRHDRGQTELSGRAVDVQVRAARASRARGSASCCRTRRRSPTTCASSSRCTPSRSITIRRSRSPDRLSARGPAEPGRVGRLRAGQREPGSAGLRRDDHRRTASRWPTGCGARVSAEQVSGRQAALGRRSGAVPLEPGRASTATQRARFIDDLGQAEPGRNSNATQNPEIATRIAQYEMAFRMQTSVPELTDLSKEPRAHVRAVRPGFAESRARSPRTACWRGGWPSAACGSSSSITAAGTITAACRRAIRDRRAEQVDQPSAALIQDLKQRGLLDDTLVIWGGEFGRTVYSPGQADGRRLRPRSSPALLHDLDGGRRHQARDHARRDRRLRLQHHRRTRCTSTI